MADVRFGSFSSDRRAPDARGMSASLRKRTCANSPRYVCLVPMVMRALLVALAGESRSISPPSLEIARRMMAGFEPATPSSRTRCRYQKAAARIACSCLTGEALLTGTSGRRMYQPPPRLMHQTAKKAWRAASNRLSATCPGVHYGPLGYRRHHVLSEAPIGKGPPDVQQARWKGRPVAFEAAASVGKIFATY